MLHRIAVLIGGIAMLTACDMPHPAFSGAEKQVVTVEGSTFSIYRRADWVEVYRTSFEALPRPEDVQRKARVAIMQATGCDIQPGTMTGDQALMRVQLDCSGPGQQDRRPVA